jgi:hypothetical protein
MVLSLWIIAAQGMAAEPTDAQIDARARALLTQLSTE